MPSFNVMKGRKKSYMSDYLVGVGAGVFSDAAEGVSHIVHYEEAVLPIRERVETYDGLYDVYRNIHRALTEHGSYKMLSNLQVA